MTAKFISLPEFKGSVKNPVCVLLVHSSLYKSWKLFICRSIVELYPKVIHRLFSMEKISRGGFSSPQNLPIDGLEELGPSLISKNGPKQFRKENDFNEIWTLHPSRAKIIHMHLLSVPQTAGLFELAMSCDDAFACRMKGASVENEIRNRKYEFKKPYTNVSIVCMICLC